MSDAPAVSFGTLDLDEGLRELIKPELAPGERLLWAGRSKPLSAGQGLQPYLQAATWGAGLIGVAVACLVAPSIPSFDAKLRSVEQVLSTVGILTGIAGALVTIGVAGNWLSNLGDHRQYLGQTYALTDRRAILWTPGTARDAMEVHVIQRGTVKVAEVHRVQHPDGSGDVILRSHHTSPEGFRGIAEVRRVENLVREYLVVAEPAPTA